MDTGLKKLAEVRDVMQQITGNTILLYGNPKCGKTGLAATITMSDKIQRVFFLDPDNSISTVYNADLGFTDAHRDKIAYIPITESPANPVSIETALKWFSTAKGVNLTVCLTHGRVNCGRCAKEKLDESKYTVIPSVQSLTKGDCIVIDTISQIGMAAAWAGDIEAPGKHNSRDKYKIANRLLTDLLHLIKATTHVPIICLAHTITIDTDDEGNGGTIVPQVGTANFSRTVGGFFSHVVYMEIAMKAFKGISTPTQKVRTIAGSRTGAKLEQQDLRANSKDRFLIGDLLD